MTEPRSDQAWSFVDDARRTIGECPVWDDRTDSLYWIDVEERALFRGDLASGAITTWTLSDRPGSITLRRGSGLLIAFRRGLALFDPGNGAETPLAADAADFTAERFNDGACDRAGRFWVGSLDRALASPSGGLFCLEPDGRFSRKAGDITVSNGIAWSPDNRTLYQVDSAAEHVLAYDFDIDDATVRRRRLFVDFTQRAGTPDGCAIDAEGGLWVAAAGAGQLVRFDAEGRESDIRACPIRRVTSLTFGGPDLRTAYVTSMRFNAEPDDHRAGCTISVPMPVAGVPLPRFAG